VDSFDATFKVLQYINETEASDPPQTTNHPTVPVAIDRLRATARGQFSRSEKYDDDDALWYAKALPYYDEATRTNALTSLRAYFHDNRKAEFNLESLWAYAHFSGDWELVKQNWELVKKQFRAPADTHWAGSGPDSARFNDSTPNLTAPCLALARLAYKIGDMDTYNYASYRFARELTRASADERGATYLRHHQPWDSMKFTDEPTGPTNSDRWTRFNNEDVGRFYRDHLKEDGRRELALLLQKSEPKRKHNDDPHLLPSEIRLRSLLLNETPAQLAAVATPDQFSGPPSGVIASCLSVLRTSHPTRYERLIPAGEPSPFVAGLEREVAGPNPYLIQAIQSTVQDQINQTGRPIWPEVTWGQSWKTPTGHKWTFGHVTPVREETPTNVQTVPLNWNTEAFTYGLKLL
jgi:hypothetical protein